MKLLQLLMLGLSACIIAAHETTPKPCDKSLLVNYDNYHKLFEMTMKDDKGTIYDDASTALKYSGGDGWSTVTADDETFIMNFTLLEKCSGNWEIANMGFKTAFVYQLLLKIENDVKRKWPIDSDAEAKEFTTAVSDIVAKDNFLLVFRVGTGRVLIAGLYVELTCNCTHESTTSHKTLMDSLTGTTLTKILESTKSLIDNTETVTTNDELTTLPELTCVGKKDGLYTHPYNCTIFIQCSNHILHVRSCPEGLDWDKDQKLCDYKKEGNITDIYTGRVPPPHVSR